MADKNKELPDFSEYIRQGEPQQKEKAYLWRTAIGLQQVDGLLPSDFLLTEAKKNIEGKISLDEVKEKLRGYYEQKTNREPGDDEKEEADKVAANIANILSTRTFAFNENGYISLHRRIFEGVFKHAGSIRDFNITKKEWVLGGDTVNYLNWEDLKSALVYDIDKEKQFSYKGLSEDQMISHLTQFVSGLWQIHPFREGNTRTTAVFAIQYLRSIGFEVNNEMFARHSWYFRNALVRANYKNIKLGIEYSPIYLERFFRNLLLGENWDLKNRYLHICPSEEWKVQPNDLAVKNEPEEKPQFVVENILLQLSDRQRNIYGQLLHTGEPSVVENVVENVVETSKSLAATFGVSERTIQRDLTALQIAGLLKRSGPDNGGCWRLVR